ncbi:hypothetical protein [Bradyrhizobium sp. RDM4]|uniref:hypothetical protein n=1 Tax=Bradyrhizobium sp. RDM4 TaxID=3378765 RepID=UPI0038FCA114
MTAKRYSEAIQALGWKAPAVAAFFDVTERHAFRWQAGTTPVPLAVAIVLGLLVAGKVTPKQLNKIIGRS